MFTWCQDTLARHMLPFRLGRHVFIVEQLSLQYPNQKNFEVLGQVVDLKGADYLSSVREMPL